MDYTFPKSTTWKTSGNILVQQKKCFLNFESDLNIKWVVVGVGEGQAPGDEVTKKLLGEH